MDYQAVVASYMGKIGFTHRDIQYYKNYGAEMQSTFEATISDRIVFGSPYELYDYLYKSRVELCDSVHHKVLHSTDNIVNCSFQHYDFDERHVFMEVKILRPGTYLPYYKTKFKLATSKLKKISRTIEDINRDMLYTQFYFQNIQELHHKAIMNRTHELSIVDCHVNALSHSSYRIIGHPDEAQMKIVNYGAEIFKDYYEDKDTFNIKIQGITCMEMCVLLMRFFSITADRNYCCTEFMRNL